MRSKVLAIHQFSFEKARINSINYWKKSNKFGSNESLADLVDDRDTISNLKKKNNKKYQNPVISAIEYNYILSDIKKSTNELRENLKEE